MAGRHQKRQPEPSTPRKRQSRNTAKSIRPNQGKKRKRRIVVGTAVAAIACIGVAYAFITRSGDQSFHPKIVPLPSNEQQRLTTLLIGTDTRPGQTGGNTDVLIVMSIDYQHKRIELLSIPRDTKVMFLDGTYGKINEAYDLGGVRLTDDLIQGLTGMSIPNYAITHFGGLVNVINTVGGISLNVPERMDYNTGDKQYGLINLYPGNQTLNGAQALGYVRFREDSLGDIGRTMRQQAFLKALSQALFRPGNVTKLPKLISEFWSTIQTNLSIGNVFAVASGAEQLKSFKIISETLPGAFHNPSFPGDASYWIVNPQMTKWAASKLFFDGVIQPNIFYTEDQVNNWTVPLASQTPTTSGNATPPTTTGNSGTNSTPTGDSNNSGTTSGSTSTPSTTSDVSATAVAPIQMVVSGTSANIRSGPSTNDSVIGSLTAGATVTVIGKAGTWDQVAMAGGGSGYIADFLLSPTE